MLEIVKFIFSGFWVWLGATIMLSVIASVVATPFAAILNIAKLRVYEAYYKARARGENVEEPRVEADDPEATRKMGARRGGPLGG